MGGKWVGIRLFGGAPRTRPLCGMFVWIAESYSNMRHNICKRLGDEVKKGWETVRAGEAKLSFGF